MSDSDSTPLGIRLVLGISRLGDADLAGWWSSHGLGEVGEYVLADLFPRTWRPAAVELSMKSAAKRHADFLPARSNILHLFSDRLSFARQSRELLAEFKTGEDAALLGELQSWTTRQIAETRLREWAGDPPSGERIGQALLLGALGAETLDHDTLVSVTRLLGAAYLGQGDNLAIPYFDIAS
ncbi:BrxE family protein [Mycolicibacterium monacense]|uniref:BrxE family protein n=1 Tax=Mycolicibacterium monacense TaxID=85693 RepID=UPI000E76706D|nr:BrxE family protein [Mycolicibacterium monacense]